jgi:FkbM family methyltransferase
MLKKIKQAFRIFFPKKINRIQISEESIFVNNLKSNALIFSYQKIDNHYLVSLKNNLNVYIRDYTHSDYNVFQQIFIQEEYHLIQRLMILNTVFKEQKNIIDAGANVGYTTVYFSNIFHNASIFAIEPSFDNAKMFQENTENLKNTSQIKLYQKALAHKPGLTYEIDRNFRDGKDWSIATSENSKGNIEGISIQEIITENNLTHISLLKVDIEGAERFVFKQENDLSFLRITELIAIEIHDEFEIRDSIYKILLNNNFLLLESGELTIGINKTFL